MAIKTIDRSEMHKHNDFFAGTRQRELDLNISEFTDGVGGELVWEGIMPNSKLKGKINISDGSITAGYARLYAYGLYRKRDGTDVEVFMGSLGELNSTTSSLTVTGQEMYYHRIRIKVLHDALFAQTDLAVALNLTALL